jgi:plastocyanin
MVVGAAVLLLALSAPASAATTVDMTASFQFAPPTITVHVGDTVTWVHDGTAVPHSVTADDGSFDSSPSCPPTCLGAGASYQHTFSQAGTFAYHCRIHGAAGGVGMAGTVVVVAAPPSTTTAPVTTTVPGSPATTPATTVPTGGASPTTVATLARTGSSRTQSYVVLAGALVAIGAAALAGRRRLRPAR